MNHFNSLQDREKDHNDQNDGEDDGDADPFPAALLVIPCNLELIGSSSDEGTGMGDMAFDVVEVLPLSLYQRRHVQEHLV